MKKSIFLILLCIGFSIRFFHLGEELDSPHVWRQSDTANYIWDFYQNGISLGKPSVCWMGGHKTLILEFPLVEASIALFYHIFTPSHRVARLFILLSFVFSCVFLYKIVGFFLTASMSRLSVLFYLFMPLSIFYSRAVHIDYFAMFLSMGMVYFYLKGLEKKQIPLLCIGSFFCALALMTKAPYTVLFAIPLLWYILSHNKLKYTLRTIYIFITPLVIFMIWQNHVYDTNAAAPEWNFVPGYRKFTHNAGWYYGPWEQRISLYHWKILVQRFVFEVGGLIGLVLAGIGFYFNFKRQGFFTFWLIGCIVYLLIFFNLNVVHNYYQIPFAPMAAVFMAWGIQKITGQFRNRIQPLALTVIFSLFIIEHVVYTERNYYQIPHLQLDIGEKVNEESLEEELVIINFEHYDSKCPNFLYAAKRNGWQIPEWGFTESVIYKLMLEGAQKLATARQIPLQKGIATFLDNFPAEQFQLRDNYTMHIYDLDFKYIWNLMPESEQLQVLEKGFILEN